MRYLLDSHIVIVVLKYGKPAQAIAFIASSWGVASNGCNVR